MRSALFCASSAERIFLFVVPKRLRAFRNYFFTGGGRSVERYLLQKSAIRVMQKGAAARCSSP